VEIEIEIHEADDGRLELLTKALEILGAPVGSVLRAGDRLMPFGRLEGLGLYLNGTDLPAEVYASSDVNLVLERLEELLGDDGAMHGHWEGPRETALYFYGPSFARMAELIGEFVAAEPLCRQARVVQLA
jgi:hypothetical protein